MPPTRLQGNPSQQPHSHEVIVPRGQLRNQARQNEIQPIDERDVATRVQEKIYNKEAQKVHAQLRRALELRSKLRLISLKEKQEQAIQIYDNARTIHQQAIKDLKNAEKHLAALTQPPHK
jgi:hypothetical protein